MNLKIRLSENLDSRLRAHAEATGATLNSIVCLAIDSFLPASAGDDWAVKAGWTDEDWQAFERVKAEKAAEPLVFEPQASVERVIVASKQPVPLKPILSLKPTKGERAKLAEWHRAYGAGQRDLLDKA